MPDDSLRLRIDVDNATLRQLSEELKRLKEAIKDAIPGSTEFNEGKQAIIGLTEKVKEATSVQTKYTEMVKTARMEARLYRFAIMELFHGIEGLTTTIGALSGATESGKAKLKEFTTAAQDGLAAGLGLNFALNAMGGTLANLSNPISLAVGGFVTLIEVLSKGREATLKETEAIQKTQEQLVLARNKLGLADDQYTKNFLINRAREIDAEIILLKGKKDAYAESLKLRLEQTKIFDELVAIDKRETDEAKKKEKEKEEAEKKREAALKKIAAEEKEHQKDKIAALVFLSDIEIGAAENVTDRLILEERRRHEGAMAELRRELVGLPELHATIHDAILMEQIRFENELKKLRTPSVVGVQVTPLSKPPKESFDEIMGDWMQGIGILQGGFGRVSDSIQRGILEPLGEAHSLFQMFVQDVIAGIVRIAAQIAESAIIAGIFSLLGFNFGSIFGQLSPVHLGGGGGGGGTTSHAAHNESPLSSFGGHRNTQRIEVYGESRISSRDIIVSFKEGRVIDRKLGGNL